jgi:hypothetical protein
MTTGQQAVQAITEIANIIEDAVREAGAVGVPSGIVYAALMNVGIDLSTYQAILSAMVEAGRITVTSDLIKVVA